jgi:hypothetical protein
VSAVCQKYDVEGTFTVDDMFEDHDFVVERGFAFMASMIIHVYSRSGHSYCGELHLLIRLQCWYYFPLQGF